MNRYDYGTNRLKESIPKSFSISHSWPLTVLIAGMSNLAVAGSVGAIGPEMPIVIVVQEPRVVRSQSDFASEAIEIELRSNAVEEIAVTTVIENSKGETVATRRMTKSINANTNAEDTDGDGVLDEFDNCSHVPNAGALACDTDMDGYGNACDADFNNDGVSDGVDFSAPHFMFDFSVGAESSNENGRAQGTDMNCDGIVDGVDFSQPYFLTGFAAGVPGASGLACAGTVPCAAAEANLAPAHEVAPAKYGDIVSWSLGEIRPLEPGVYSSTVDVAVSDVDYDVPVTVSQTQFFEVSRAGVRDIDSAEFSAAADGSGHAATDKNGEWVIVHHGKGFEAGSEKAIRKFQPKIVNEKIENLDNQVESGSAGEILANDRSEIEEN